MPTTTEREQQKNLEQHQRETMSALVGEQVIHTLGKPGELLKVQARRLWENYYRVNIFVGVDPASGKVANSYFLEVDADGKIIASTPKITRQY